MFVLKSGVVHEYSAAQEAEKTAAAENIFEKEKSRFVRTGFFMQIVF
jgi:hypothetical protein